VATLKQYTLKIWQAHRTVSAKLGSDVASGSLEQRAAALSADAMIAILIKCLTDNAILTDAQLNATLTAALSVTYPPLPTTVTPTSDAPVVPDPDLGV
jgi:hypothetical protein